MIYGVHTDVWLGAVYAVFLVAVAAILERLALHSHRFSKQLELAGFTYQAVHDRWQCPQGHYLERDPARRHFHILAYRAPAQVCRACHCREDCTDSEDGRRIEHRPDSWVQSELRRFHRGLSLVLLLLAGLILAAEISRGNNTRDWLVILGLLLPILSFGARLLTAFIRLS